MREVRTIILTERQEKIVEIVRESGPITGNRIAEQLNVTRAALRSDLAIITMLGIVDARPKLGYFYTGNQEVNLVARKINSIRVSEVLAQPVMVKDDVSAYDTVIMMFTEDVGTVFVGENGFLSGVVSRKDLLKSALGNNLRDLPVRLVMTPVSKMIFAEPDEEVLAVAQRMLEYEIDCVPVVEKTEDGGRKRYRLLGRVSKTSIAKLFVECGMGRR